MNMEETAEIRNEYFDKLQNTKKPGELIKKGNKVISKVEVELTMDDVKKEIRNLKKITRRLELMEYIQN